MAEKLKVQVCYASEGVQFLRELQVEPGTTLEQAVRLSGVLTATPEIDLDKMVVGIYAKKKTLDTVLRAHDRVELYRPLIADPKQARRRRKSPVE